MPLVDDRGFHGDRWQRIADDGALPDVGDVIVPLDRLDEALARPGGRTGVDLPPDGDPDALVGRFADLSLIAVHFPGFADGRGFSLARRLRTLGFTGQLRASGHVICDQYAFLRACGFDHAEISTDLAKRQPQAHWQRAARSISQGYQRRLAAPDRRRILAEGASGC